jgi:hypothetical protein
MSDPIKRRSTPASSTRKAAGLSSKSVATLAVVAVMTMITIGPFLIAIINAAAPVSRLSAVPEPDLVTRWAWPLFGTTLPGHR